MMYWVLQPTAELTLSGNRGFGLLFLWQPPAFHCSLSAPGLSKTCWFAHPPVMSRLGEISMTISASALATPGSEAEFPPPTAHLEPDLSSGICGASVGQPGGVSHFNSVFALPACIPSRVSLAFDARVLLSGDSG